MTFFTYLVTGGAGFIGSHLSRSLASDGHRVKILDNFSSRSRADFESLVKPYFSQIQIIEGDVRDRAACKDAVSNAEFILHHAAMASVPRSIEDPEECLQTNVVGTTNLLVEAAASGACRRFVFASSSAVYGDQLPLVKNEGLPFDPLSPYASSKAAGEMLCNSFSTIHGLATVSLRYFNVYGKRQDPNGPYAAVIPRFIEAIQAGISPTIFGDGEQSRDFVSVRDVIRANRCACDSAAETVTGKAFNIASGRRTSLNDLVTQLSHIVDRKVSVNYLPARVGDIRHSLADISLAKELLNYTPTVSLEDGLRGLLD